MKGLGRFVAAVALSMLCASAHALRVEDIPTPRPNGWVSDQAELLDADTEAKLNALGDSVHAHENAELAIVTVRTTDGAEQRAFATQLFKHWQIGDRERDNGVLIFVAIDDRAAEIILGDGVDSDEHLAVSDRIMQSEMMPRFRDNAAQGAIIAGAVAVARDLLAMPIAAQSAETLAALQSQVPEASYGASDDASAGTDTASGLPDWAAPAAGGAGGLGLLTLGLRRWMRYRPRKCDRCNAQMTRLEESADDAHLAPSELKEEQLKSVDYDIWACASCSNVRKVRYGALFTSHARCPKCKAVTKSSTQTTLVSANYDHGGRVRVDERCEFCGYQNSFERATAKLTKSSSSSGSGFSGGSSSGRGSSGRW